jgi:hypothetical protein
MNTPRGVQAMEIELRAFSASALEGHKQVCGTQNAIELHAFSASALEGHKQVCGTQNAMGAADNKIFLPLLGIELRIVGCSVVAILAELFSFPREGES